MRLAQVRVPADQREETLAVLEEFGVDYVVTEDDTPDRQGVVVFFPVPTGGVATVFDRLHAQGLEQDAYAVLTKVESASTERFGDLDERFTVDGRFGGLPRSELHWKVREITWGELTYHVGTLISVLVAAVGLLLDSVALVIGSMVIAPQVSTALSASVGVVLADWELFRTSVRKQVVGLGAAVLAATGLAWIARTYGVVPSSTALSLIDLVRTRHAPGLLSTFGAVGAGAAGAFGFTTEQTTSLVGVMVAAAIIPAAAATGLALAWGMPALAIGAALLLAVNLLAINVGSFATLWGLGYAPDGSAREWLPERQEVATLALIASLVVATVAIGGLTQRQVGFDRAVDAEVEATLQSPEYAGLEPVQITTDYAGLTAVTGGPRVTVELSRPADRAYPGLADDLDRRIENRTDREVDVRLVYRESARSS